MRVLRELPTTHPPILLPIHQQHWSKLQPQAKDKQMPRAFIEGLKRAQEERRARESRDGEEGDGRGGRGSEDDGGVAASSTAEPSTGKGEGGLGFEWFGLRRSCTLWQQVSCS